MVAQIVLCDGFEVAPPPLEMNDLILFETDQSGGSNCYESTVTTEEDVTVFSGDSSPGGAAEEEWSETKPFSFYFVKQRAYDDPDIEAKIDEADSEIYQCNKRRIDISNTQKLERVSLLSLYDQMESLGLKSKECKAVFEETKREFETLQEGLRCSSTDQLGFSKEEFDHLMYMARYVTEHGSIGFEEEDWLLKETEKPDGMILCEDSLAEKDTFIQRIKSYQSLAVELNEIKKELEAITWNINQLSDKMGQIQNKISALDVEMAHVLEHRDKSYEKIKMLRIQRDKRNAEFFQSNAVMRKAKELAAFSNVRDLEVYASSEVERFMTRWNNDKAYRDDYVKRISFLLSERQLSQDRRIREHEGKLVLVKQALVKNIKEGEVIHKMNAIITDIQKKEVRNKEMGFSNKSSTEESDVTDLEFPVYEKEEEEVDKETLKERKREEQLEKARLAMERKRKLQEKAAIRAQKEAEKKLKLCEKKAKKKAAANSSSPLELDQAINELEEVRTLGKEKQRTMFPKQRIFRYKHSGRGTEALPKAILNRRKAHRYWLWGLSSAALALTLFLLFLLLQ